jgi:hypothetical protein
MKAKNLLYTLREQDTKKTVTVKEVSLVDKDIEVIENARNGRQLGYAETIVLKIQNLKKEYDDIIERLVR